LAKKSEPAASPQDEPGGAVAAFAGGLRLAVKARPGMARQRAPRLVDIGDGKRALEITVAAAAEDGKANRAIGDRLAELLGVKKNAVNIKNGATGRLKLIEITGDATILRERLKALLA
jgi:uncharacterized protein YggU (UPF0235/DUF167 family)